MPKLISGVGFGLSLLMFCLDLSAADFVAEFDGPETSWHVDARSPHAKVAIHQRRRGAGREGGAEFIRFQALRENSPIRLQHTVPAAVVLDELVASVWVKSEHEGMTLSVRIVLPENIDPETRLPRTLLIVGDSYRSPGEWQQLKCRTTDRSVREQLQLKRALKQIVGEPSAMYVDQMVLDFQLPPGNTDVHFDDLSLSSLVRYEAINPEAGATGVQPATHNQEISRSGGSSLRVPVQFRLHRLQVEGRPFFPRVINYQKERPETLLDAGINVAWVPDYENTAVTGPLRRQGLWITSAPPYAKGADGEPLESDDASLLPFGSNTSSVLFWMLGARMTMDGHPRLTSWTNQIRDADRATRRPIAADVVENERLVSRHVDLLGISRHVIQSNCSLTDYRDWMIQRRDLAWPDSFCWTWIQTEVIPTISDVSRGLDMPPMLEPEQMRLQVYAALAAGCRGLGFWTTTSLDDESSAARERLLMLTQLNLELDLFEPWITSGGKPELVSFAVDTTRTDLNGNAARTKGTDPATKARDAKQAAANRSRELKAAMIGSDRGALLLPMWLEENSQFVPGPMSARNVMIIVPGGGETAAAWEITTTGRLRHLDREPAAGGVRIKLPQLDQTSAILITSDMQVVEELNEKIASIEDRSAHVSVELARLKFERTIEVDQMLQELGVGRPEGRRLTSEAQQHLQKAESALQARQFIEARQQACESMQFARFLQRMHWDYAIQSLPNVTSSPYAGSFQSLPEHWRLMRRITAMGSPDAFENLLPSGEFEDIGTLVAEHWNNAQSLLESVQSSAELHGVAKQGDFSLRLIATPISNTVPANGLSTPPVTVVSPSVHVQAGQIVRITGWAKIPAPLVGSIDGALIYDSLMGKAGAVRLKGAQDWQRFELLRPVPESQDLTVTISLHGLGEMLVDDLRITAFELPPELPQLSPTTSPVEPAKFSPLNLRRLNPLQRRR